MKTTTTNKILAGLLSLGLLALQGCGGGGGGGGVTGSNASGTNAITVVPALGGFSAGATVTLLEPSGKVIATAQTNAQGEASLTLGSYAGPLITSVVGGPGVTFFNEKTLQQEAFTQSDSLLAVSPEPPKGARPTLGVTPLTNAAAAVLIANPTAPSFPADAKTEDIRSQMALANATVAVAVGLPSGVDILAAPRALTGPNDRISSSDPAAVLYGSLLAALAQAAPGNSLLQSVKAMAVDAKANKGALPASAPLLQQAAQNLNTVLATFVAVDSRSNAVLALSSGVAPDPTLKSPASASAIAQIAKELNGGVSPTAALPSTVTPTTPAGGGGGGGGSTQTSGASAAPPTTTAIRVFAGIGYIGSGAAVQAIDPATGLPIASGAISSGYVDLDLGKHTGPFILKMTGGSGTTYFDPGLNGEVPFTASDALLALVPGNADSGTAKGSSFGISTLTHMAAGFANVNPSSPVMAESNSVSVATQMQRAIALTRLAMGFPSDSAKLRSIHNFNPLLPPEVITSAKPTIDVSKPGGFLGVFLAELASNSRSGSGRSALDVAKSLYTAAADVANTKDTFASTNDSIEIGKALNAVSSGLSVFANSCYALGSSDLNYMKLAFSAAVSARTLAPSDGQKALAQTVSNLALADQNQALYYPFDYTKQAGCP